MTNTDVQSIAKATMLHAIEIIRPGMRLSELRCILEDKMLDLGADSFWYWGIGAFIFSGEDTVISVSGPQYVTADKVIQDDDIITIDLSPQFNNIWGDYSRTIIIEDGKVVCNIKDIKNSEWRSGLLMEEQLHRECISFVTPYTTFEELYLHINKYISEKGYANLDFLGNLGHSIVKEKKDRIYIEKGNKYRLGDVNYFTFEPHISRPNSIFGYKMENIYYFDKDVLKEL